MIGTLTVYCDFITSYYVSKKKKCFGQNWNKVRHFEDSVQSVHLYGPETSTRKSMAGTKTYGIKYLPFLYYIYINIFCYLFIVYS